MSQHVRESVARIVSGTIGGTVPRVSNETVLSHLSESARDIRLLAESNKSDVKSALQSLTARMQERFGLSEEKALALLEILYEFRK